MGKQGKLAGELNCITGPADCHAKNWKECEVRNWDRLKSKLKALPGCKSIRLAPTVAPADLIRGNVL